MNISHKKTILKSGLRIISAPMKNTETVTFVVACETGSRFENDQEAGLSHFIEHMFFKGTQKRPTTLEIAEELDSIGGEFNAYTSKDRTVYFAKVDSSHLERAFDVISDIYLNSKIEENEIEKEKGTIIQEINMYEDTPTSTVHDVFEKVMYDENSLGREIIGYKKTVSSFKRKDFQRYIENHYHSGNTIIGIAGKFDEKSMTRKISERFALLEKKKKTSFLRVVEEQKKPQMRIKKKQTDQTHLVLGVRAFDQNHKDRYILSILSVILGGNMSSRLFTEVREKRGLAYSVSSFVEAYRDCGYLAARAGVEHANLELTIKTILAEFKKMAEEKVSAKELKKAKEFIKGRFIMDTESSDEVVSFLISQEIARKKIVQISEIFRRIEKVTAADIQRVAKYIFKEKNLNLAVIGPLENQKEIGRILKL